jgi:uncharacterized protein (TIGR03790 family)
MLRAIANFFFLCEAQMSKYAILSAIAVGMALTGQAFALTPSQVLVVANANSSDSMEIAHAYMTARDIPAKNLLTVSTGTQFDMSQADCDSQIGLPIQAALKQRNLEDVKCICLIYGIPVRINNSMSTDLYVPMATKAHYRLAGDHQLVSRVGLSMPTSIPSQLLPAGKLFAEETITPHEPLLSVELLKKDIQAMLASKLSAVPTMPNARTRAVAMRQLMALHLDIYGLAGLIDFIQANRPDGAPELEYLKAQLAQARQELANLPAPSAATTQSTQPAQARQLAEMKAKLTERIAGQLGVSELTAPKEGDADNHNSVDSQLSLLMWSKPEKQRLEPPTLATILKGSAINPLLWQLPTTREQLPQTFMTARLDGPSKDDVLRMISDSVEVENTGLEGVFYIDAGVTSVSGKSLPAYAAYDMKLKRLAAFVTANSKMPVVLDENQAVFKPGSCPNAALYVGWYSLQTYVPAFVWNRGSFGFHIASFEAMQLRDPNSSQWCPKLIQNGIAGTLGPVWEPYLTSFPPPEEFFPLLLTGKFTVAECYWRTIPQTNWRQTLIADPLYTPFKNNPQVPLSALPDRLAP